MKLINEEYWNHWETKRIERDDGRPQMPKELPNVNASRIIYDPPWIWNSESEKYSANVMNHFRVLVNTKPPKEYDGTI